MYIFWALTAVLAVVSADVGLGYNYKVPHTSYGVPSYQFSEGSSHHESILPSGNFGNADNLSYKAKKVIGGYQGSTVSYHPVSEFPHHTVKTESEHGTHYSPSSITSGTHGQYYPSTVGSSSGSSNVIRPVYNSFIGDSTHGGSSNYNYDHHQSTAAHKHHQYYVQQQPAQVYKHYYMYTAPEELEQPRPRTPIVLPPPQKHYKIIVVKTPSNTHTPQVIPVPQQHEEKTIVYVLSKKQDKPQDILVPKIENKPPSPPEVHFLEYKDEKDAHADIKHHPYDYSHIQDHTVSFPAHADGSSDRFGSSSSASFDTTSHGLVDSYPSYPSSTGSHGHPPLFSEHKYNEQYSVSPVNIHEHGNDFVTETYGIDKVSSGPQTFALATANAGHIVDLPVSSTTTHDGYISGNDVVSTTTSSLAHDNTNIISTSQGVPHETYGPPKFRPL